MTEFSGAWTASEVSSFLDETAVPLRLASHTPSDDLWVVTLWYRFRDGDLYCATSAQADIVRFVRRDPSVAFDVSTNDQPYKGVRGNGTAHVEPDPEKTVLRDLIERYVGDTDTSFAGRLLAEDREEVTIRIEPDRMYSWDFTARMADVER